MTSYVEKLFSLNGKTAIVTGASRGIGAALAQALAQAGARVVGVGRSAKPESTLPGVDYRSCDVRDQNAFRAAADDVFSKTGRVDILINAAGITVPTMTSDEKRAVFDETIATNLTAAHRCCEVVAPLMKRGGGGSIVNVTSIGSALGFPGNPGYVAAKGGLSALTRALAMDFAADGIRVNSLAPGYVRTAMTEASYSDPTKNRERLQHTILGRWGTPQDLAGAAIFLASEASAYLTGTELFVDGGWTAKGL
jgi:NAD(P)-dependent dehydrogenase (short-subunit alcohol dehydrogenase family)